MAARRFILLLDPKYPVEREALSFIKATPDGEGSAFLRALILIGYADMKKEAAQGQIAPVGAPRAEVSDDRTI